MRESNYSSEQVAKIKSFFDQEQYEACVQHLADSFQEDNAENFLTTEGFENQVFSWVISQSEVGNVSQNQQGYDNIDDLKKSEYFNFKLQEIKREFVDMCLVGGKLNSVDSASFDVDIKHFIEQQLGDKGNKATEDQDLSYSGSKLSGFEKVSESDQGDDDPDQQGSKSSDLSERSGSLFESVSDSSEDSGNKNHISKTEYLLQAEDLCKLLQKSVEVEALSTSLDEVLSSLDECVESGSFDGFNRDENHKYQDWFGALADYVLENKNGGVELFNKALENKSVFACEDSTKIPSLLKDDTKYKALRKQNKIDKVRLDSLAVRSRGALGVDLLFGEENVALDDNILNVFYKDKNIEVNKLSETVSVVEKVNREPRHKTKIDILKKVLELRNATSFPDEKRVAIFDEIVALDSKFSEWAKLNKPTLNVAGATEKHNPLIAGAAPAGAAPAGEISGNNDLESELQDLAQIYAKSGLEGLKSEADLFASPKTQKIRDVIKDSIKNPKKDKKDFIKILTSEAVVAYLSNLGDEMAPGEEDLFGGLHPQDMASQFRNAVSARFSQAPESKIDVLKSEIAANEKAICVLEQVQFRLVVAKGQQGIAFSRKNPMSIKDRKDKPKLTDAVAFLQNTRSRDFYLTSSDLAILPKSVDLEGLYEKFKKADGKTNVDADRASDLRKWNEGLIKIHYGLQEIAKSELSGSVAMAEKFIKTGIDLCSVYRFDDQKKDDHKKEVLSQELLKGKKLIDNMVGGSAKNGAEAAFKKALNGVKNEEAFRGLSVFAELGIKQEQEAVGSRPDDVDWSVIAEKPLGEQLAAFAKEFEAINKAKDFGLDNFEALPAFVELFAESRLGNKDGLRELLNSNAFEQFVRINSHHSVEVFRLIQSKALFRLDIDAIEKASKSAEEDKNFVKQEALVFLEKIREAAANDVVKRLRESSVEGYVGDFDVRKQEFEQEFDSIITDPEKFSDVVNRYKKALLFKGYDRAKYLFGQHREENIETLINAEMMLKVQGLTALSRDEDDTLNSISENALRQDATQADINILLAVLNRLDDLVRRDVSKERDSTVAKKSFFGKLNIVSLLESSVIDDVMKQKLTTQFSSLLFKYCVDNKFANVATTILALESVAADQNLIGELLGNKDFVNALKTQSITFQKFKDINVNDESFASCDAEDADILKDRFYPLGQRIPLQHGYEINGYLQSLLDFGDEYSLQGITAAKEAALKHTSNDRESQIALALIFAELNALDDRDELSQDFAQKSLDNICSIAGKLAGYLEAKSDAGISDLNKALLAKIVTISESIATKEVLTLSQLQKIERLSNVVNDSSAKEKVANFKRETLAFINHENDVNKVLSKLDGDDVDLSKIKVQNCVFFNNALMNVLEDSEQDGFISIIKSPVFEKIISNNSKDKIINNNAKDLFVYLDNLAAESGFLGIVDKLEGEVRIDLINLFADQILEGKLNEISNRHNKTEEVLDILEISYSVDVKRGKSSLRNMVLNSPIFRSVVEEKAIVWNEDLKRATQNFTQGLGSNKPDNQLSKDELVVKNHINYLNFRCSDLEEQIKNIVAVGAKNKGYAPSLWEELKQGLHKEKISDVKNAISVTPTMPAVLAQVYMMLESFGTEITNFDKINTAIASAGVINSSIGASVNFEVFNKLASLKMEDGNLDIRGLRKMYKSIAVDNFIIVSDIDKRLDLAESYVLLSGGNVEALSALQAVVTIAMKQAPEKIVERSSLGGLVAFLDDNQDIKFAEELFNAIDALEGGNYVRKSIDGEDSRKGLSNLYRLVAPSIITKKIGEISDEQLLLNAASNPLVALLNQAREFAERYDDYSLLQKVIGSKEFTAILQQKSVNREAFSPIIQELSIDGGVRDRLVTEGNSHNLQQVEFLFASGEDQFSTILTGKYQEQDFTPDASFFYSAFYKSYNEEEKNAVGDFLTDTYPESYSENQLYHQLSLAFQVNDPEAEMNDILEVLQECLKFGLDKKWCAVAFDKIFEKAESLEFKFDEQSIKLLVELNKRAGKRSSEIVKRFEKEYNHIVLERIANQIDEILVSRDDEYQKSIEFTKIFNKAQIDHIRSLKLPSDSDLLAVKVNSGEKLAVPEDGVLAKQINALSRVIQGESGELPERRNESRADQQNAFINELLKQGKGFASLSYIDALQLGFDSVEKNAARSRQVEAKNLSLEQQNACHSLGIKSVHPVLKQGLRDIESKFDDAVRRLRRNDKNPNGDPIGYTIDDVYTELLENANKSVAERRGVPQIFVTFMKHSPIFMETMTSSDKKASTDLLEAVEQLRKGADSALFTRASLFLEHNDFNKIKLISADGGTEEEKESDNVAGKAGNFAYVLPENEVKLNSNVEFQYSESVNTLVGVPAAPEGFLSYSEIARLVDFDQRNYGESEVDPNSTLDYESNGESLLGGAISSATEDDVEALANRHSIDSDNSKRDTRFEAGVDYAYHSATDVGEGLFLEIMKFSGVKENATYDEFVKSLKAQKVELKSDFYHNNKAELDKAYELSSDLIAYIRGIAQRVVDKKLSIETQEAQENLESVSSGVDLDNTDEFEYFSQFADENLAGVKAKAGALRGDYEKEITFMIEHGYVRDSIFANQYANYIQCTPSIFLAEFEEKKAAYQKVRNELDQKGELYDFASYRKSKQIEGLLDVLEQTEKSRNDEAQSFGSKLIANISSASKRDLENVQEAVSKDFDLTNEKKDKHSREIAYNLRKRTLIESACQELDKIFESDKSEISDLLTIEKIVEQVKSDSQDLAKQYGVAIGNYGNRFLAKTVKSTIDKIFTAIPSSNIDYANSNIRVEDILSFINGETDKSPIVAVQESDVFARLLAQEKFAQLSDEDKKNIFSDFYNIKEQSALGKGFQEKVNLNLQRFVVCEFAKASERDADDIRQDIDYLAEVELESRLPKREGKQTVKNYEDKLDTSEALLYLKKEQLNSITDQFAIDEKLVKDYGKDSFALIPVAVQSKGLKDVAEQAEDERSWTNSLLKEFLEKLHKIDNSRDCEQLFSSEAIEEIVNLETQFKDLIAQELTDKIQNLNSRDELFECYLRDLLDLCGENKIQETVGKLKEDLGSNTKSKFTSSEGGKILVNVQDIDRDLFKEIVPRETKYQNAVFEREEKIELLLKKGKDFSNLSAIDKLGFQEGEIENLKDKVLTRLEDPIYKAAVTKNNFVRAFAEFESSRTKAVPEWFVSFMNNSKLFVYDEFLGVAHSAFDSFFDKILEGQSVNSKIYAFCAANRFGIDEESKVVTQSKAKFIAEVRDNTQNSLEKLAGDLEKDKPTKKAKQGIENLSYPHLAKIVNFQAKNNELRKASITQIPTEKNVDALIDRILSIAGIEGNARSKATVANIITKLKEQEKQLSDKHSNIDDPRLERLYQLSKENALFQEEVAISTEELKEEVDSQANEFKNDDDELDGRDDNSEQVQYINGNGESGFVVPKIIQRQYADPARASMSNPELASLMRKDSQKRIIDLASFGKTIDAQEKAKAVQHQVVKQDFNELNGKIRGFYLNDNTVNECLQLSLIRDLLNSLEQNKGTKTLKSLNKDIIDASKAERAFVANELRKPAKRGDNIDRNKLLYSVRKQALIEEGYKRATEIIEESSRSKTVSNFKLMLALKEEMINSLDELVKQYDIKKSGDRKIIEQDFNQFVAQVTLFESESIEEGEIYERFQIMKQAKEYYDELPDRFNLFQNFTGELPDIIDQDSKYCTAVLRKLYLKPHEVVDADLVGEDRDVALAFVRLALFESLREQDPDLDREGFKQAMRSFVDNNGSNISGKTKHDLENIIQQFDLDREIVIAYPDKASEVFSPQLSALYENDINNALSLRNVVASIEELLNTKVTQAQPAQIVKNVKEAAEEKSEEVKPKAKQNNVVGEALQDALEEYLEDNQTNQADGFLAEVYGHLKKLQEFLAKGNFSKDELDRQLRCADFICLAISEAECEILKRNIFAKNQEAELTILKDFVDTPDFQQLNVVLQKKIEKSYISLVDSLEVEGVKVKVKAVLNDIFAQNKAGEVSLDQLKDLSGIDAPTFESAIALHKKEFSANAKFAYDRLVEKVKDEKSSESEKSAARNLITALEHLSENDRKKYHEIRSEVTEDLKEEVNNLINKSAKTSSKRLVTKNGIDRNIVTKAAMNLDLRRFGIDDLTQNDVKPTIVQNKEESGYTLSKDKKSIDVRYVVGDDVISFTVSLSAAVEQEFVDAFEERFKKEFSPDHASGFDRVRHEANLREVNMYSAIKKLKAEPEFEVLNEISKFQNSKFDASREIRGVEIPKLENNLILLNLRFDDPQPEIGSIMDRFNDYFPKNWSSISSRAHDPESFASFFDKKTIEALKDVISKADSSVKNEISIRLQGHSASIDSVNYPLDKNSKNLLKLYYSVVAKELGVGYDAAFDIHTSESKDRDAVRLLALNGKKDTNLNYLDGIICGVRERNKELGEYKPRTKDAVDSFNKELAKAHFNRAFIDFRNKKPISEDFVKFFNSAGFKVAGDLFDKGAKWYDKEEIVNFVQKINLHDDLNKVKASRLAVANGLVSNDLYDYRAPRLVPQSPTGVIELTQTKGDFLDMISGDANEKRDALFAIVAFALGNHSSVVKFAKDSEKQKEEIVDTKLLSKHFTAKEIMSAIDAYVASSVSSDTSMSVYLSKDLLDKIDLKALAGYNALSLDEKRQFANKLDLVRNLSNPIVNNREIILRNLNQLSNPEKAYVEAASVKLKEGIDTLSEEQKKLISDDDKVKVGLLYKEAFGYLTAKKDVLAPVDAEELLCKIENPLQAEEVKLINQAIIYSLRTKNDFSKALHDVFREIIKIDNDVLNKFKKDPEAKDQISEFKKSVDAVVKMLEKNPRLLAEVNQEIFDIYEGVTVDKLSKLYEIYNNGAVMSAGVGYLKYDEIKAKSAPVQKLFDGLIRKREILDYARAGQVIEDKDGKTLRNRKELITDALKDGQSSKDILSTIECNPAVTFECNELTQDNTPPILKDTKYSRVKSALDDITADQRTGLSKKDADNIKKFFDNPDELNEFFESRFVGADFTQADLQKLSPGEAALYVMYNIKQGINADRFKHLEYLVNNNKAALEEILMILVGSEKFVESIKICNNSDQAIKDVITKIFKSFDPEQGFKKIDLIIRKSDKASEILNGAAASEALDNKEPNVTKLSFDPTILRGVGTGFSKIINDNQKAKEFATSNRRDKKSDPLCLNRLSEFAVLGSGEMGINFEKYKKEFNNFTPPKGKIVNPVIKNAIAQADAIKSLFTKKSAILTADERVSLFSFAKGAVKGTDNEKLMLAALVIRYRDDILTNYSEFRKYVKNDYKAFVENISEKSKDPEYQNKLDVLLKGQGCSASNLNIPVIQGVSLSVHKKPLYTTNAIKSSLNILDFDALAERGRSSRITDLRAAQQKPELMKFKQSKRLDKETDPHILRKRMSELKELLEENHSTFGALNKEEDNIINKLCSKSWRGTTSAKQVSVKLSNFDMFKTNEQKVKELNAEKSALIDLWNRQVTVGDKLIEIAQHEKLLLQELNECKNRYIDLIIPNDLKDKGLNDILGADYSKKTGFGGFFSSADVEVDAMQNSLHKALIKKLKPEQIENLSSDLQELSGLNKIISQFEKQVNKDISEIGKAGSITSDDALNVVKERVKQLTLEAEGQNKSSSIFGKSPKVDSRNAVQRLRDDNLKTFVTARRENPAESGAPSFTARRETETEADISR